MIKFYSDVTKKYYKTAEEAEKAEAKILKREEEKEAKLAEVKKAYKEFKDKSNAFIKEYGKLELSDEDANGLISNHLIRYFLDI